MSRVYSVQLGDLSSPPTGVATELVPSGGTDFTVVVRDLFVYIAGSGNGVNEAALGYQIAGVGGIPIRFLRIGAITDHVYHWEGRYVCQPDELVTATAYQVNTYFTAHGYHLSLP